MREKIAWSGIEEVITAPTRNQSSILEADQREPLEILGISGHKGFGKSLISLPFFSPISKGKTRESFTETYRSGHNGAHSKS